MPLVGNARALIAAVYLLMGAGDVPYDVIFDVMDSSGDGAMDFPEFVRFLKLLNMNLDFSMMRRMYQYADEDSDGYVMAAEFESAWSYLKDDLAEEMLVKTGRVLLCRFPSRVNVTFALTILQDLYMHAPYTRYTRLPRGAYPCLCMGTSVHAHQRCLRMGTSVHAHQRCLCMGTSVHGPIAVQRCARSTHVEHGCFLLAAGLDQGTIMKKLGQILIFFALLIPFFFLLMVR